MNRSKVLAFGFGITIPVSLSFLFLLASTSSFEEKIDVVQTWAAVTAAGSIFFALAKYLEEKTRKHTTTAIEHIAFFREKVINQNQKIVTSIRQEFGQTYVFQYVGLEIATVANAFSAYEQASREQAQKIVAKNELRHQVIFLLNAMEELALRILHHKTQHHPALVAIKRPFLEIVEIHAMVILHTRTYSGLPSYQSIINLYQIWKSESQRWKVDVLEEKIWREKLGVTTKRNHS